MGLGRFGQARYKPAGEWVQATRLIEVAGIQFRKSEVRKFARALIKADRQDHVYGLKLHVEPDNPHDPNAIAVFGVAIYDGWFRRKKCGKWHVGYVPAEVAADVTVNLVLQDVPIAAELYSIFHGDKGDDYWDIKFFVLAPPGNSASKRERAARYG
jgi:hypothetical protein